MKMMPTLITAFCGGAVVMVDMAFACYRIKIQVYQQKDIEVVQRRRFLVGKRRAWGVLISHKSTNIREEEGMECMQSSQIIALLRSEYMYH